MKFLVFILLQVQVFNASLNKIISDFKSKPDYQGINISASIRSMDSGKEIYSYQSAMNLPPASTLKLLTTATAFKYLGAGYHFETMIYSNGNIIHQLLNGDLVFEGVGDPSFGSWRFKENPFEQILAVLENNQIKKIAGSIKIAGDNQPDFPLTWLVGDLGNYYGAFPGLFNFHENLYTVYFNGGKTEGDPAQIIKIYPYDSSWRLRNEVKTGPAGSGDQVNILNLPFSNDISLVGTIPLNAKSFAVKGAMPGVNSVFTDSLTNYLKANGIVVENKIFPDNLSKSELGSVISPSVSEIAKETNYQSVNFLADGLAQSMWKSEAESYSDFVKSFWEEEGVNLKGHNIYDGSGLAPQNNFSTQSMTRLLLSMKADKDFFNSIPVVGKSGTVSGLGKNTNGLISAKSGSISGTKNYSGYFSGLNGKKYAFSIYVSGFTSEQSRNLIPFFNDFFTKMLNVKD